MLHLFFWNKITLQNIFGELLTKNKEKKLAPDRNMYRVKLSNIIYRIYEMYMHYIWMTTFDKIYPVIIFLRTKNKFEFLLILNHPK